MTDHQLSYCNVCTRKAFDPQLGLVCSLTGRKPDFDGACPTFDPISGADVSRVGKAKAFTPYSVGLGKRVVNLLIDTLVYYALVFVSAFGLFTLLAIISPDWVDDLLPDDDSTPLWTYPFAIAIYLLYYTGMESGIGRTVGKLVTGTRVVDAFGKKPTLATAIKRSLSRLVPFEGFSFLGGEPRGWHDRWTETFVVENNVAEDIFEK